MPKSSGNRRVSLSEAKPARVRGDVITITITDSLISFILIQGKNCESEREKRQRERGGNNKEVYGIAIIM